MLHNVKFDEVLDAVEALGMEEQAELVEVVRKRLAEVGRQRIVKEVEEARGEIKGGGGKVRSVDDIMGEIAS